MPDTGVTAVMHSKLFLRVGPEVFDEEKIFQAALQAISAWRTTSSITPAQMYTSCSELS